MDQRTQHWQGGDTPTLTYGLSVVPSAKLTVSRNWHGDSELTWTCETQKSRDGLANE